MESKVNDKLKLVQVFLSKTSSPGPSVFEVYTNKVGDLSCTCPGYNGRKSCKHTKFVKDKFDANTGAYPLEISKGATLQDVKDAESSPEMYRKFILKYGKIEVL